MRFPDLKFLKPKTFAKMAKNLKALKVSADKLMFWLQLISFSNQFLEL